MTAKQQYTSKDTSISVVNKVYKQCEFIPGTNILDYGGGKYNRNIEYMATQGCKVVVYDPYNRNQIYNMLTMQFVKTMPIHYIVCSNVLNVIKEDAEVEKVLQAISKIKSDNDYYHCKVYVVIYEGNRTNEGKATRKGWQRNEKLTAYLPLISKYFKNYSVKGNIITCE